MEEQERGCIRPGLGVLRQGWGVLYLTVVDRGFRMPIQGSRCWLY